MVMPILTKALLEKRDRLAKLREELGEDALQERHPEARRLPARPGGLPALRPPRGARRAPARARPAGAPPGALNAARRAPRRGRPASRSRPGGAVGRILRAVDGGAVVCSSCQRENPPGARYCNGCGAALAAACAACGHENPPTAAFCNACGGRLGPAAAPAEAADPRSYTPRHLAERILRTRAAVEGERKHVTVLFCDVVDSTPLAARLGPEGMHAAMDRLIQLVCAQVHAYEGTVNQFLGDGTMALFGAPLALEDAPRRALAAALGIQRAVARLAAEDAGGAGADLRVRIGIHSGPVVVGRIGDDLRMDYTAVGDTTHLAARLQGAAAPGRIVVSEATQHLVSGWFDLRDLGGLALKGVPEPVRAFEVLAERPVRDRVEARLEAGLTPLVGRERELAALEAAFAAARAGRGQVAFVVGEAGLGKSRLLFEFRRRLGAVPLAWLEGRCASYARATAFHPIADALRRALGISDRDDEAAALATLEEAEAREGGALAWTLPYLRHLLSLPCGDPEVERLDPATRRSEAFRALRARVERAASRGPFVLVVEDLHWIDRASEEFLGYLADAIAGLPALLVLTHRPGYSHPFGDRSYHSRVALQPLSAREMGEMAGAVLEAESLPPELGALIAQKAEGNPFFVEEVAKSLLEEGALRRVEGRVELARPLGAEAVPDSIHGVLMARLDRLGDEPKHALQIASVIGREFAVRLLERIHEVGDRLHPLLAELRGLELIHEKAVQPEIAFMFKHALTHDVAYASVLAERRKALHRIVGSAIEELYADRLAEHYEALAHHFTEGDDLEKGLHYSALASEKAAEVFANEAAAEHCRRALAVATRLGERVPAGVRRALEERLGHVSHLMSEFAASGDAYLRAAALSEGASERAINRGRAAYTLAWAHDYPRATRAIEEGLAEARACRGRRGPGDAARRARASSTGSRATSRASKSCSRRARAAPRAARRPLALTLPPRGRAGGVARGLRPRARVPGPGDRDRPQGAPARVPRAGRLVLGQGALLPRRVRAGPRHPARGPRVLASASATPPRRRAS